MKGIHFICYFDNMFWMHVLEFPLVLHMSNVCETFKNEL